VWSPDCSNTPTKDRGRRWGAFAFNTILLGGHRDLDSVYRLRYPGNNPSQGALYPVTLAIYVLWLGNSACTGIHVCKM